jgi:probable H4MPT-linked C1 transfer pathway protein
VPLTKIIGLDIGGANTKAASIRTKGGKIEEIRTSIEYFPIWKNPERLPAVISNLCKKTSSPEVPDCVAVTMTAELSDVYRTKREGINHVADCVLKVFPKTQVLFLDVDANLRTIEEVKTNPLTIAAANWVATGWMLSKLIPNCVIIDVGSTSTSIIPVTNGRIAACGKTDLEKLVNGELVYTGSLRTNIATIVSLIPVQGGIARVSSELFAQSGDVHLILGNIEKDQYVSETADGKGKTRAEAMARLARVVCADLEMLTEEEIVGMAQFICDRQIEQISEGLSQVCSRKGRVSRREETIVVTGFGKIFLAQKAAQRIGIEKVVDLNDLVGSDVSIASPAVGVALMAANKIEGVSIKWKQS